jgi:soluble lytic murein transglycosylase-like protein
MQVALDSQRTSIRAQAAVAHPGVWSPRVPARRASLMRIQASGLPSAPSAITPPPCDPLPPPEMASLIDFAAQSSNVNPLLIREVARQESGFRPCALSSQGAMGLMQLMPDTQTSLGVANPWDPRQSIEAGSRLLRQLLDRYHGDLSMALGAYNAGTLAVDQSGGVPRIPETRNYVNSILYRLFPGSAGTMAGDAAGNAVAPAFPGQPPLPKGLLEGLLEGP